MEVGPENRSTEGSALADKFGPASVLRAKLAGSNGKHKQQQQHHEAHQQQTPTPRLATEINQMNVVGAESAQSQQQQKARQQQQQQNQSQQQQHHNHHHQHDNVDDYVDDKQAQVHQKQNQNDDVDDDDEQQHRLNNNNQQQQQAETPMVKNCLVSLLADEKTRQFAGELIMQGARSEGNSTATATNDPAFLLETLDMSELARILPAEENPTAELEALSERWQMFLVVIYSITAITSFILNVITVIVLSRCKRSELRKYLINLSMSDLLMSLLSIPFTYTEYMLGRWVFASFLCPVVRCVVTLSVFVSVATMVVIGINRHLAIMYPLKRKKYAKFKRWTIRKTHVIVAIWLFGLAISTPEYLMFSTKPFCFNRRLYFECGPDWPHSTADKYTVLIFMATFLVPLSLLSYLYTSIGLKLWRRQCPGNVDVNRDLTMQTKRVKCVKMLFVVVLLFAVFWLPLQTFSMVTFLNPDIRKDFVYQSSGYNIFIGTYFACHWLSMSHSCLNPLIYCFMNEQFRTDLKMLICGLISSGDRNSGERRLCTGEQASALTVAGGHSSKQSTAARQQQDKLAHVNYFANQHNQCAGSLIKHHWNSPTHSSSSSRFASMRLKCGTSSSSSSSGSSNNTTIINDQNHGQLAHSNGAADVSAVFSQQKSNNKQRQQATENHRSDFERLALRWLKCVRRVRRNKNGGSSKLLANKQTALIGADQQIAITPPTTTTRPRLSVTAAMRQCHNSGDADEISEHQAGRKQLKFSQVDTVLEEDEDECSSVPQCCNKPADMETGNQIANLASSSSSSVSSDDDEQDATNV